jgi:hypothetical protein
MIFDVLVLALFYMAIFGVTTLQLYAGQLDGRCGQPDFSLAYTDDSTFIVQVRQLFDIGAGVDVVLGECFSKSWIRN